MKRRSFLQTPLLAPALTLPDLPAFADPIRKGFVVREGQDRRGKSLDVLDARFDLKISGKDCGGAMSVYDTTRFRKVGPRLHIHPDLDEWFHVIDGEFKIQIGEETFRLNAGDSAFGPRGVPHAFVLTSEPPGRLLLIHEPARQMEALFEELATMKNHTLAEREIVTRKYGLITVGPPLSPD